MEFNLRYRLLSEGRNEEYDVLLVPGELYTIGRQGQGLELADPSVSRIHCTLLLDGSEIYVLDDKSTNGTFYKGKRIQKHKVEKGDVIKLGVYTIEFIETFKSIRDSIHDLERTPEPEFAPRSHLNAYRVSTPVGIPRNQTAPHSDDLELSPDILGPIYKKAILNPAGFFQGVKLNGSIVTSWKVIVICAVLINLIQVIAVALPGYISLNDPTSAAKFLGGSLISVLIGTFIMVIEVGIAAYILELCSGFLEAHGGFSEYIRFFAYVSLLAVPCQLLSSITLGVAGAVLFVAILVWTVIGFMKAFGAGLGPTVVLFVFLYFSYGALEKLSLERFGPYMLL